MLPRGVLNMLSIVRVGILETIASIMLGRAGGIPPNDEKRNYREDKRKGQIKEGQIKEENFHAATAKSKSRSHLRRFPSVASSAPLYY